MSHLKFGKIRNDALHICIDMQLLFLQPGPWYCDDGVNVLEPIKSLIEHNTSRTIFTRFITPENAKDAQGAWKQFYARWESVTLGRMNPSLLEIHPDLLNIDQNSSVLDKKTYDAFKEPLFSKLLENLKPSAIIFSGIETDVCVMATVLSAVDLGYRVIVASDAITSSNRISHLSCMEHFYPRYDQQIEIATTSLILTEWGNT